MPIFASTAAAPRLVAPAADGAGRACPAPCDRRREHVQPGAAAPQQPALFRRGALLALGASLAACQLGAAGPAAAKPAGDAGDWSSPGLAAPVDPSQPRFFKTASGVKVQVLAEGGNGPSAAAGDVVLVDFVLRRSNGYFIYGTVDGVSFQPKDVPVGPVALKLGDGSVVPGLEEALLGSRPGTKLRALVPPELGYAAQPGSQPQMPTFATQRQLTNHRNEPLLFEVQLLRVGGAKGRLQQRAMSSSGDGEPGWRMDAVDWSPVAMTARPRSASAKAGAKAQKGSSSKSSSRAANFCCQVEGCPRQLLPLRSYYQRQHICEDHFRALSITDASGRVTRFCQQCTKLESLSNFDGERRSCRVSLERRNARRQGKRSSTAAAPAGARARRLGAGAKASRAVPPSPSSVSDAPGSHSSGSGSGSGSGSVTRMHDSAAVFGAAPSISDGQRGGAAFRAGQAATAGGAAPQPLAVAWPGGAALPSSGGLSLSAAGVTGYWVQPLSATSPTQAWSGHSGSAYPTTAQDPQPTALAALQAPAAQQQVLQLPKQEHQPYSQQALLHRAPPQVSATSGLGSLSSLEIDQLLALDADALADAILQGSSASLPPPMSGELGGDSGLGAGIPALLAGSDINWHRPAASPSEAVTPALQPQRAWHAAMLSGPGLPPLPQQPAPQLTPAERLAAAELLGDLGSGDADELEAALLAELAAPPLDEARFSFKLFGVRPEHLPPHLRSELMAALCLPGTAVHAALRAGCVHLTLTALLSAEERAVMEQPGAAAAALARLLPLASQLPARRILAQVGTSSAALLAVPRDGRPAALLSLDGAMGAGLPCLAPASPIATTVSAAGGRFRLRCPRALLLGGSGASLHCRVGGRHAPVALLLAGAAPLEPSDDEMSGGLEGGFDSAEEHPWNGCAAAGMETRRGGVATDAPPAAEIPPGHADVLPADGGSDSSDSSDFEGPAEGAELDEVVEVVAVVAGAEPIDGGAQPAPGFWQAGWGLYEFEASQGAVLGEALPLLVLPDAATAAAAELARMRPGALSASLLRLAGAVLAFLEARHVAAAAGSESAAAEFAARYPPLAVSRLAAASRKLLDVAERAGWPAVTALLLPAAGADGWRPPAARDPTAAPATAAAAPAASADLLEDPPSPSVQKALNAGKLLLSGGDVAGGSGKPLPAAPAGKLALSVPELSGGDGRERVMHPAVLAAATVLVTGAVLGVGVALVTGQLG